MAIKETSKKIHFIPYNPTKGKDVDMTPAPVVTVSRKYMNISFTKGAVLEMGMSGKFIKLYYEPIKKVIGWQLRDHVEQREMKMWKLVKPTASFGNWKCNIKKMLDQFGGRLTKETYKNVPIQKYREASSLSEYNGQTFYFVELIDNPEELKKGVGNEHLASMTVL